MTESTSTARGRLLPHPILSVLLFVVWLILYKSVSPATIVGGIVLGEGYNGIGDTPGIAGEVAARGLDERLAGADGVRFLPFLAGQVAGARDDPPRGVERGTAAVVVHVQRRAPQRTGRSTRRGPRGLGGTRGGAVGCPHR